MGGKKDINGNAGRMFGVEEMGSGLSSRKPEANRPVESNTDGLRPHLSEDGDARLVACLRLPAAVGDCSIGRAAHASGRRATGGPGRI